MPNYVFASPCPDSVRILHAFNIKEVDPDNYRMISGDTLWRMSTRPNTYIVTPNSPIAVMFVVEVGGRTDTIYKRTKPVVPTIYLGGHHWRKDSIRALVARSQRGIYAQIEGYDIDAKCSIRGFSLTWVRPDGRTTIYNNGGDFGESARFIMDRISPGDLLLFRQITYRCPGGERDAGARDLIFTVY